MWPLPFTASLVPLFSLSTFPPLTFYVSLDCCNLDIVHRSPEISLLLSSSYFPHWEQTWRPITLLDNARHKSSIGLSDTWGLSTRGNMRSSILFSFYSLSPSFVPSFSVFMNWFRESYVALQSCFATFNLHICFCFSFVNSCH